MTGASKVSARSGAANMGQSGELTAGLDVGTATAEGVGDAPACGAHAIKPTQTNPDAKACANLDRWTATFTRITRQEDSLGWHPGRWAPPISV